MGDTDAAIWSQAREPVADSPEPNSLQAAPDLNSLGLEPDSLEPVPDWLERELHSPERAPDSRQRAADLNSSEPGRD